METGAPELSRSFDDFARRTILLHCAIDDESRRGILNKLRPFQRIDEQDFSEMASAILMIGKSFVNPELYELVRHIWNFCWTIRSWGVRSSGILRTNAIISDTESALLDRWCDVIEQIMLRLLGPHDLHEAAHPFLAEVATGAVVIDSPVIRQIVIESADDWRESYRETCAHFLGNCGIERTFVLPLLRCLANDPDSDVVSAAKAALIKLESK